MSLFPETSVTLLASIAARQDGDDEAAWARFFELYAPAIGKLAEMRGRDPDDVVQEVLAKLVDILRGGRFRPGPVRFRTYLATLVRNELVSLYRRESVRGEGRTLPLAEETVAVPEDAGAQLDAEWRVARRRAAVDHVLTKTALSEQYRGIYRAYAVEERPAGEVARAFGVSRNFVSQVKTRVDRLVTAVEAEMGD